MTLFHRIEEAQAVIRRKGIYRQVPLYHRNGKIYAAYQGGYIQLLRSSSTTHPDTSWEEVFDPLEHVRIATNKEPATLRLAAPVENEL